MSHEAERQAILTEARTWLRTPWKHAGSIKGVGVDCAMLPLTIAKALGHVAQDYDPRPYPEKWYLHHSEEIFVAQLERYAHRIPQERLEPADLIMYRMGRAACHAGIVVDDDYIIHAYRPHGAVTLHERRGMAQWVDSFWSLFP